MSAAGDIVVSLRPGEYFVGDQRHQIHTLLGSCVSITLWHPERRIGAMSHFLLADRPARLAGPPDARYGTDALGLMMAGLLQHGVAPMACRAKIFGGGDMFPQHRTRLAAGPVGQRNGEVARQMLDDEGIPVVSESLFGVGHRRIMFDVKSGHVWVRQVKPVDALSIHRKGMRP